MKTRLWYSTTLRLFSQFLTGRGHTGFVRDVTLDDAQAYLDDQRTRGRKVLTIQNRSRALRAFFHWFDADDHHRLRRLEVPRPRQDSIEQVEILTTAEISAIERSFDLKTHAGKRNRALVALMLDTGIRHEEALKLTLTPQQLETGAIRVLGKGSKYRSIPFGYSTADDLQNYLAARPETAHDEFFLTEGGQSLTPSTMRDIFRQIRKRSGVSRVHPHLLRHTYATLFVVQHGDRIAELQRYLGHTTLSMVMHYVHLAEQQIREVDRRLAPMDRLRESYRERQPGRPKKLTRRPSPWSSAPL
ncbi:MAG: tyrosine-type recombinase/integrase [Chloroflexota bacterium]